MMFTADGQTRTIGSNVYQCIVADQSMVTFKPNPPPPVCPPKPADEQRAQACPANTVGTWLQDQVWTLQPAPTCWVLGDWTPTAPPAGMCAPADSDGDGVPDSADQCPTVHAQTPNGCPASPPPTCSPAPASQTRQVPCGVGYTGTYSEVSSSIMGPPTECRVTTTWTPVPPGASACVPQNQPPSSALFSDQFEYAVSREDRGASSIFPQHGWSFVKSNNSNEARGGGWVYTQANAAMGSRVLVLESNPGSTPMQGMPYSQTDYYLQYGREGSTAQVLPANVWIQFATYATPESRFSTRDKTIYPCSTSYPCTWGPNLGWLFMWGSGGFNVGGDGSSRRFLAVEAQNADNRGDSEYPTNKSKLRQNVSTTPLAGGVWYDVKLHLDTSGAQGTYEAWVRQRGQSSWTKVSDWRGGQTANFFWPIPENQRRGHTMFRLPTTVNGPGDSKVYVDDFKIAQIEAALN
jgi:hypothetical protein